MRCDLQKDVPAGFVLLNCDGASSGAQGIIFCSISEAVREHPELVRKHLGSVVRGLAPVLCCPCNIVLHTG